MVEKSSPKKNFIYNMIYQLLVMIIPIITAPYLSRVLGAGGVGQYSYTYSIVYYFMLLTMLGVNNYGNRTIAKVRNDKSQLSKSFWSIYFIQLIMGSLMVLVYLTYVLVFDNKYKLLSIIQTLFIFSSMLDINWLFFGLEEFKKTITRNTFVKIGNLLLIFLLVKTKGDTWKYALIMSSMTLLSQIILWGFAIKKVSFTKVKWSDISNHLIANVTLFIPVIAVSLYKIMDKIMLGAITNVSEVGLFENAEKIVNIPLTLITALGTVMLPRMSNIIAKGNFKKAQNYIEKSVELVMFLSLAMFSGLFSIGYRFAPLFFGEGFQKSGLLIMLLSSTLPFISFANVIRTQYLIPKEKDKIYIKSVFWGAFVNLAINLIFIPSFKSLGACFGTIVAEFTVMFYQAVSVKNELNIRKYIQKAVPFFIKAFIMFISIFPINFINKSDFLIIIFQISIGVSIYSLLNIKYILEILGIRKKL